MCPGPQERERLARLSQLEILDTPPEESFDRLTRLAARLLDVPVTLVSLVDDRRQFFKSQHGLPEPHASLRETPLSHSFCQHVVTAAAPLVVSNARRHPQVCDNPAIPDLGVLAYLGVPLKTSDGVILGALCAIDVKPREWSPDDIGTLADLSRSVITELELRQEICRANDCSLAAMQSLAVAEEAARARSLCLGSISHDIRTPLNAIVGFAELLTTEPGDVGSSATIIHDNGQRLLRLIDDLVDIASMDSVGARCERDDVGAVACVNEVVAMHRLTAESKRLAIHALHACPQAAQVHCDPARLRQVLDRLIGLAIRSSHAGSICVKTELVEPSHEIHFVVSDAGPGIAAAAIEHIFDPCLPADADARQQLGSVGMGLAVCRQLVEMMGGRIAIFSHIGQGTQVRFSLPMTAPQS